MHALQQCLHSNKTDVKNSLCPWFKGDFNVLMIEMVFFSVIKSHNINGIQVEVKKAMERDQRNGSSGGGRGRGGIKCEFHYNSMLLFFICHFQYIFCLQFCISFQP